jgi:hypothetical protein
MVAGKESGFFVQCVRCVCEQCRGGASMGDVDWMGKPEGNEG